MLQQTQVATVIDYFNRFMKRFPTVRDLAAAELEEVLRMWEGLGYYRRARQLHAAAVEVVEKHGGVFPEKFDDVLNLPGIGRYTAGAILSIARDQKLPVVEANTLRLYSRLIALRNPPAETASSRLLWTVAEALLPTKRSGRFNQAAMELGALVCSPRNPSCDTCPLESFCQARCLGLQESIPGKVKKMVYEDRKHIAVVVARQDKYFLRVCQPGSHWAGLWDFPRYDVTQCSGNEIQFVQQQFAAEFGGAIEIEDSLAKLRHGVTKYRIELNALRAAFVADAPAYQAAVTATEFAPGSVRETSMPEQQGWFTLKELESLPLNTTGRKLVKKLSEF